MILRTFSLEFHPTALKEWRKLGATVGAQFVKKLAERLDAPHVPSAQLSGLPNCYKIKLRQSGYRLVYRVCDELLIVMVVAVGKRDGGKAYKAAAKRID